MKNQSRNVERCRCSAPTSRVRRAARQQPREQRRAHDAEHGDRAHDRDRVAEQAAREPVGLARRCPRRSASTNVGTSTADSAPAASSSNSTFDTEFAAWNVLPRYVVPSTAAITSTRTKPISRDAAVTPPIRTAARVTDRASELGVGCVMSEARGS